MDKSAARRAILDRLRGDFASLRRVSKNTRELGNDTESKPEGKYDTLAIEENYLADGLARRAQVAAQAIAEIEKMSERAFASDEEIDLGALVELRFGSDSEWFYLAAFGGGVETTVDGASLTVVTPESPLGICLLGSRAGDQTKSPSARIVRVL